jgi:glycyl-tRNA synthetase alpha subunit
MSEYEYMVVQRARELFNFVSSAVSRQAAVPRFEVFSLYNVLKAVLTRQEVTRFKSLTQAQTTTIDEHILSALHELFSILDGIGVKVLDLASDRSPSLQKVAYTTYLRGKASANFIQLNATGAVVLTNPTTFLAELQNIVAVIHELYSMYNSLQQLPAGGGR